MTTDFGPYENLGDYPLEESERELLYDKQLECMVAWSNRDGWPVAVMHWFVWRDGSFWVTAMRRRKRVTALRERPHSCVVVSSAGTRLGPARTVTAKTIATIHEASEVGDWFFPALASKAWAPVPTEEQKFRDMLFGTDRIVIELSPVQYITYDAMKMQHEIASGRGGVSG